MKIVKEGIGGINSILKPKTQDEVVQEIERRIKDKPKKIVSEGQDFVIYQFEKGSDIKEVAKNMSGRDEDVFYNFYLILDKGTVGYKQIIGVKVSPDGTMNAMDANGGKVQKEYLEKFA